MWRQVTQQQLPREIDAEAEAAALTGLVSGGPGYRKTSEKDEKTIVTLNN